MEKGLEDNLERGGNGNSVAGYVRGFVRDLPRRVIKPPIDGLEILARIFYDPSVHGTYETLSRVMTSVSNAARRFMFFYGGDGVAYRVATVESAEQESQPVQATVQPEIWLPPNYLKPDDPKRLHLEVGHILSFAKKVADYDGFRFGNQIKRRTEDGEQVVGLLDPNTGIITTTDGNLYSAVIRAVELMNSLGLNYRIIGIQFKN